MEKELRNAIEYARARFQENPDYSINQVARMISENCVKTLHKGEIQHIRHEVREHLAQRQAAPLPQPPHPGVLIRKKSEGFVNHPRLTQSTPKPEQVAPAQETAAVVEQTALPPPKLQPNGRAYPGTALARAIAFAKAVLAAGPRTVQELQTAAAKEKISWHAWLLAANKLKLKLKREKKYQGTSFYSLPNEKRTEARTPIVSAANQDKVGFLIKYVEGHQELFGLKLLKQINTVHKALRAEFGTSLPNAEVSGWLRIANEDFKKKSVPAAAPTAPVATPAAAPSATSTPSSPALPTFNKAAFDALLTAVGKMAAAGGIKNIVGVVEADGVKWGYPMEVTVKTEF